MVLNTAKGLETRLGLRIQGLGFVGFWGFWYLGGLNIGAVVVPRLLHGCSHMV